jgi:sucrose-6-phosphate hydrolase SacC (GH32 family)
MFSLDGTDVLLVCPQGLEADGIKYHNSHQAGYFLGRLHTAIAPRNVQSVKFSDVNNTALPVSFSVCAPSTM